MTNVVFPKLYFILTAKKCNSIWWLLIASLISVSIYLVACEQALLGVGGGRDKENPPPRELVRRLSIWGSWRCRRLSLLKDCRLYAPHSQIWPAYKLETAFCLTREPLFSFKLLTGLSKRESWI